MLEAHHVHRKLVNVYDLVELVSCRQDARFLHLNGQRLGPGNVAEPAYEETATMWLASGLDRFDKDTRWQTGQGATFVVHRDRILLRSLADFRFMADFSVSRDRCCGLERIWHLMFGEPALLPAESVAFGDDQY